MDDTTHNTTPNTTENPDVSPAEIGAWLHYLATSIIDMLPPGKSLGDYYALGEDHFVRELYDLAKMVAIQDFTIYEQCSSQDLDAAEIILYAVPDEIAIRFWRKTFQTIDEVGYSPLLKVIDPALLVEDVQSALRDQYI